MINSWLLLVIFSLASFRLTRLLVFDKITAFLRNPFHEEVEVEESDGTTMTYIKIKGSGLRYWIGELLSCYWCTGIWCSAFLYMMWLILPIIVQPIIILLAVAGLSGIIETVVSKIVG